MPRGDFGALRRAVTVASLVAVGFGTPRRAEACAPMPPKIEGKESRIDQSGVNVLYAFGTGSIEAHFQVKYSGDAERFALLIPVPSQPQVSVGSELLFVTVQNATVPTFWLGKYPASCGGAPHTESSSTFDCSGSSASSVSGAGAGQPSSDSNAPEVLAKENVGSFEVATLEPTTASGLLTWLDQNGYASNGAGTESAIQTYVDRGWVFVAVKLEPGAGADQIHPLVLSYPSSDPIPVFPMQLASIAATEDMTLRAFVLADSRYVPSGGYAHVELDPLLFDWNELGKNYDTILTQAIDSPGTNGRAFATEYAGPSSVVDPGKLSSPFWNSAALTTIDPSQVANVLETQDLLECDAEACVAGHPLIMQLLRKYLPPPAGVSESAYYACQTCYGSPDFSAWDGAAFAADLETFVIQPGEHARDLIVESAVLTRLATRISPSEMTVDPSFEPRSDLDEVSNEIRATQHVDCDGQVRTTVEPFAFDGSALPSDVLAELPAATRVEIFGAGGQVTTVTDNTAAIEDTLAEHDAATSAPSSGSDSDGGCSVGASRSAHGIAFAVLALLAAARRGFRRRSAAPRACRAQ